MIYSTQFCVKYKVDFTQNCKKWQLYFMQGRISISLNPSPISFSSFPFSGFISLVSFIQFDNITFVFWDNFQCSVIFFHSSFHADIIIRLDFLVNSCSAGRFRYKYHQNGPVTAFYVQDQVFACICRSFAHDRPLHIYRLSQIIFCRDNRCFTGWYEVVFRTCYHWIKQKNGWKSHDEKNNDNFVFCFHEKSSNGRKEIRSKTFRYF